MKFITITTDGSCRLFDENWGLYEYNAFVDGWIEFINFYNNCSLIVNEEGKLIGLDINDLATAIAREFMLPYAFNDIIVGNAILVGATDENGDTTGIDDSIIDFFKERGLL